MREDSADPGGFRLLGTALSNWGRWGDQDRRGTLNFIDEAKVVRGSTLVRTGRAVSLGLPLDERGPHGLHSARKNIVHVMTRAGDVTPSPSGYVFTDDAAFLYLQGSTQLDGLGHVGYDGLLYNNVPLESVTNHGSSILGIESLIGIQTRGVLLDLPRHFGVDALPATTMIEAGDLDACAAAEQIAIEPGDAVVVRTGWLERFLISGDGAEFLALEPGLGLSCAEWLHSYQVSLVGSDNFAIEIVPSASRDDFPLHCILIRDMGMPLAEMLVLGELAELCYQRSQWEFLFTCLPLPVVGGVGSPITPLATL